VHVLTHAHYGCIRAGRNERTEQRRLSDISRRTLRAHAHYQTQSVRAGTTAAPVWMSTWLNAAAKFGTYSLYSSACTCALQAPQS